ncbi:MULTISPECIES: HNH endonuclease signature motif containing protein [Prauserella salsuginis group]|uniref:DUF222 domain-containing protein n=1 Tax=Prauserella salsuginis TaxID=387889 RepID=A0ABW6FYU0_9PSEU|nr:MULTISPECIES: HNH endonuclease signature motif containing protein [Prauserella salsuginis group]MCR3720219.1 protein of unknown function (DUF222) [Prauserella flava]MCR3734072.1 protein of unknown function (DUF222) [Prauserella salsuginis]
MNLDSVVRARRRIAQVQAEYVRELAAVAADSGVGDGEQVTAELAVAVAESEHVVRRELAWARQLATRLPYTLRALSGGDIDLPKATKVVDQTTVLDGDSAGRVDEMIAGKLEGRDAGSIRRIAYRAVHKVDPDGAAVRAARRREDRKVQILHREDAMATVTASLPAEVASATYASLDRMARSARNRGDPRTMDQLRADTLAECVIGRSGDHAGSGRAEIYVHIDLPTLMGLADNPAELAGHGPIPAPVARQIAEDPTSTWRRVVTDPLTGTPLDVGRKRYRPSKAVADYVKVRDRECRFPGCHRPAEYVDLDHVTPHGCDGPTCAANLIGLCRHHHVVKHTAGWQFELEPDGTLHITTPRGARHTSRPPVELCDGVSSGERRHAVLDGNGPNGGVGGRRARKRRRRASRCRSEQGSSAAFGASGGSGSKQGSRAGTH